VTGKKEPKCGRQNYCNPPPHCIPLRWYNSYL
jgi:hypothetical protein